MEVILGIIFFVVIGLISAAAKSNKKRGDANQSAENQPQRSVPLSDIQRAFMMAQDNTPQQQPPQAPPRPVYTPPQQAAQRPAYTSAQPAAYVPMQARTTAPMEARMSAPMQARTTEPMQARMAAPMQARTSAVIPPHPMYAAPRPDIYSGSLNAFSREGLKDTEGDDTPFEIVRASAVASVADADLETITDLEAPVRPVRTAVPEKPLPKGLPVKLFENKNEYLKAVIYSEVLARRTPGRHRA